MNICLDRQAGKDELLCCDLAHCLLGLRLRLRLRLRLGRAWDCACRQPGVGLECQVGPAGRTRRDASVCLRIGWDAEAGTEPKMRIGERVNVWLVICSGAIQF